MSTTFAPTARVELAPEVAKWLGHQGGAVGFLGDMNYRLVKGWPFSVRQAEVVERIYRERQAQPEAEPVEPGMYRLDGVVYKVQKAVHGSGNLYAKRLVLTGEDGESVEFEYAPGVVRKLAAKDRMTLDEAKAFGALYGTCIVCGRTLTDERSIAEGIGPVCGSRV